MQKIRPIVLCLVQHQGRFLVQEFWDKEIKRHYYRPLGGGIEFGEEALQALRREMWEEIFATIVNPKLETIFENVFTLEGRQRHEIAFLYSAELQEIELYNMEHIRINDCGDDTRALWLAKEDILTGKALFFPKGLLSMVKEGKL